MGKEYRLQLNSTGVLPISLTADDHPLGFRIYPRTEFNIEGFFVRGGIEWGVSNLGQTPLGISYFDTDPNLYYLANLGYSSEDFTFRLGRHRYEQTDIENLITNNAYQVAPTFANVTVPLGWGGGEFRYDRLRDSETLRRMALELNYMRGDDGSHLGILQGLFTFNLPTLCPENPDICANHTFTLAGNGALRGNAGPDSGLFDGLGTTFGFAFAAQYKRDWFSTAVAYNHSSGNFSNEGGLEFDEERDAITLQMAFSPGNWLAQGSYTFANLLYHQDASLYAPPLGLNEHHLDAQVGYQPVDGLLISLGYRAAFPQEVEPNHLLFLGVQTGFDLVFDLEPQR